MGDDIDCFAELDKLCTSSALIGLCDQDVEGSSACDLFDELDEYHDIISATRSPFSAFYARRTWLYNPEVITTFAFFLIVSLISNLFLYCWLRVYRNEVKMAELEEREDNDEDGYTPRIRRRLSVFDINKHETDH